MAGSSVEVGGFEYRPVYPEPVKQDSSREVDWAKEISGGSGGGGSKLRKLNHLGLLAVVAPAVIGRSGSPNRAIAAHHGAASDHGVAAAAIAIQGDHRHPRGGAFSIEEET